MAGPVPKGKKRYFVTLDEDVAEALKQAIRDLGFPPNFFSAIINDGIKNGTLPIFQKAAERKKEGSVISLADAVSLSADVLKRAADAEKDEE